MRVAFSILLLLVCWVSPLRAAEKPLVQWLSPNFPPVFMGEGPNEGLGYGDQIVAHVAEHMPEYKHEVVRANLVRIYAQMKQRDGVCTAALFETPERSAFATFSNVVYHVMTNRVVALKDKADLFKPFLNAQGEVDIARLTRAQNLSVGVVPDRFYSGLINERIKHIGKAAHVIDMPFDRYGTLLLHGRIDYTFGFPAEANYLFRQTGRPDAYTAFPIAGETKIQSGGFSCSDKPQGRKIIARINEMIANDGLGAVYDRLYEEWLDERSLNDYRKIRAAMAR